jgi:hypothetical protein
MSFVQSLLRWFSTIACLILIVSFGLFVIDQAEAGSQDQVNKVEGIAKPAPTEQTERRREEEHGDLREGIDDVTDVLLQPFAGVINSGSVWATRGVATLLGLLVYGLLARLLIAYMRN